MARLLSADLVYLHKYIKEAQKALDAFPNDRKKVLNALNKLGTRHKPAYQLLKNNKKYAALTKAYKTIRRRVVQLLQGDTPTGAPS